MRTFNFAVLVLGLLGLLVLSAPANPKDAGAKGLAALNEHLTDVLWITRDLDATAADVEAYAGSLEARGRSRNKNKNKKKKNKNKDKNKTVNNDKHKVGGCKTPPKAGKGKKLPAKGGKRSLVDSNLAKRGEDECYTTSSYDVVAEAAREANAVLVEGKVYVFKHKDKSGPTHHPSLVVGEINKRSHRGTPVWDFVAGAIDLRQDFSSQSKLIQACEAIHGAKCKSHIIEAYSCSQAKSDYPKGKFEFVGTAKPEFASLSDFRVESQNLIEKKPTYTIVYNDCQTHFSKLAKATVMDPNVDPAFPGTWAEAARHAGGS